ncbi:DUF6783 domain-containing protein [Blautia faecicola]|uniref:DUF6783 domain-containing protein n=1 Tax=Blautia faecicola TaxID=2509240 RepID=UPI0038BB225A
MSFNVNQQYVFILANRMNTKCASKWDLQIIGTSFQAFSGTLFLSLMICSFKTCTSRTHIHLPAGSSVSIRLLLYSSLRRNRFHYPLLLFRSSS